MFRKLCLPVAMISLCLGGSQVQAQDADVAASAKPKVKLASYGRNYSSGCVGCSNGGGYGYGTTGGAYAGAGNAGGPQAMAYGRSWGGAASNRDCSRFYHYPYVFYPQNFRGNEYFRSSDSLYHRYPPEMQIPVYNKGWHNYYPSSRRYHWGHHFILDVF